MPKVHKIIVFAAVLTASSTLLLDVTVAGRFWQTVAGFSVIMFAHLMLKD